MYWCVVSRDYTASDITENYDKFIVENSHFNNKYAEIRPDYKELGYIIIVSTAMKSKVFGALFATI